MSSSNPVPLDALPEVFPPTLREVMLRPRWIALLALGGIIPFLSFFLEVRVAREVRAYLKTREDVELHSRPEHSSLTQAVPAENER